MVNRHDAIMQRRWKKIGEYVEAYVERRGITWETFYAESGVSEATVSKVRKGEPIVRADKRAAVCRALNWSNESIELVLAGNEPTILPTPPRSGNEPGTGSLPPAARLEVLDRELEALGQRVTTLTALVAEHRVAILALQRGAGSKPGAGQDPAIGG
jgi:hypothetical protein